MNINFEKTLSFVDKPRNPGLYKDALMEIAEDGTKQIDQYIPWRWSCCFVASRVNYISNFNKTFGELEKDKRIVIEMIPDDSAQRFSAPNYSFFGTDRKIEKFSLAISQGKNDILTCFSIPSITVEGPECLDETTEDFVGFEYTVDAKSFSELCDLVLNGFISNIKFSVSGVRGFYSVWTPSVTTDRIKIWSDKGPDVSLKKEDRKRYQRFGRQNNFEDYHLSFDKTLMLGNGQSELSATKEADNTSNYDDLYLTSQALVSDSKPKSPSVERHKSKAGLIYLIWFLTVCAVFYLWTSGR